MLVLFYYAFFYRYDLLRVFHPHRRWGWNKYKEYFGLSHPDEKGYIEIVVFLVGIITALVGDLAPFSVSVLFADQFAASVLVYIPIFVNV